MVVGEGYAEWLVGEKRRRHDRYLQRTYGISLERYEELLVEQGGTCATCEAKPGDTARRFHVDHDHLTGVVRGVLCHSCNVTLGHVRDDVIVLERLVAYLRAVEERAQTVTLQ